jgi:hypothetical protein
MHKNLQRPSKADASDKRSITAPLDEKSSAWIMEYTWTPPARPKLRRRKK